MSSKMYESYDLDQNLVEDGVWTDYGDFRVKLAHSGSSNAKFAAAADIAFKPFRQAINAGRMNEERSKAILFPIFAKHIVKEWEVNTGIDEETGEVKWTPGIEARDGSILEFNVANVVQTFKNLPNLFTDFRQVSEANEQYRKEILKADAKN